MARSHDIRWRSSRISNKATCRKGAVWTSHATASEAETFKCLGGGDSVEQHGQHWPKKSMEIFFEVHLLMNQMAVNVKSLQS